MEEIYVRIEDYLDGKLSASEAIDFESDVATDSVLAAALAEVREARERLARQWSVAADETALRKTLQEVGAQHFGRTPTSKTQASITTHPPARKWWWLALIVVLLAAVLLWVLWPKSELDQRLYAAYRHFPEASFTLKNGSVAAGSQSLEQAEADFNQKNYAAALSALQAHLAAQPDNLEARFFAGLCALELRQTAAATSTFALMADSGTVWSGEARWYLALSHLRSKNWTACAEVLRQISPGQPHYEEARRMLEQL